VGRRASPHGGAGVGPSSRVLVTLALALVFVVIRKHTLAPTGVFVECLKFIAIAGTEDALTVTGLWIEEFKTAAFW
jgi:hypothetical protein